MCPYEDAISAYLAAEQPEAWPIPRDPRNPAEAELTEEDERAYMEEQLT